MHYSPTFGGINENLPTYTAKDGSSKTEEEWGNIVLSKVNTTYFTNRLNLVI